MKEEIFNKYVEKVINLFKISREELFSRTKKRDIVDARQLLYYLCSQRNIRVAYIQKYMNDNGCDLKHSTIIHGIAAMNKKVLDDRDYVTIVNSINKSVFI